MTKDELQLSVVSDFIKSRYAPVIDNTTLVQQLNQMKEEHKHELLLQYTPQYESWLQPIELVWASRWVKHRISRRHTAAGSTPSRSNVAADPAADEARLSAARRLIQALQQQRHHRAQCHGEADGRLHAVRCRHCSGLTEKFHPHCLRLAKMMQMSKTEREACCDLRVDVPGTKLVGDAPSAESKERWTMGELEVAPKKKSKKTGNKVSIETQHFAGKRVTNPAWIRRS